MKKISVLIALLSLMIVSCHQQNNYPGPISIRTFKIGDKVDTNLFIKKMNACLPSRLDGWTEDNWDKLPDQLYGLPVAIWQLKNDSGINLTLINNTILNISVSYMNEKEEEAMVGMATKAFGKKGSIESYEQTHPLQNWITYWELQTWETRDVVIQIGNEDMRKPEDPAPKNMRWNLIYSDFKLQNGIVEAYKKELFSNKEDSLKYQHAKNAYLNKEHPPQNGLFTDYFENGKLKEKGNYKDGKKDGLWETWYENGQKEDSATYTEDNLSGTRIMWHTNGKLQLVSYWGKPFNRIGRWVCYHENGQIESVTNFTNDGEFDGRALQYFKNGKLERATNYDNGGELSDSLWDENGKLIK